MMPVPRTGVDSMESDMNGFGLLKVFVLPASLALLAGCVSIPKPLEGDYPDFYPDQVNERSVGARVRWGGEIIETEPDSEGTCIEILARKLDRTYRPETGDRSQGRFLACRDDFQDPAIFRSGREVTVIGQIEELMPGHIGEFAYRYPVVNAETLYLWPIRPDVVHVRHHPGYWGWYDPWYDPWWGYRPHPYRSGTRVRGSVHISR